MLNLEICGNMYQNDQIVIVQQFNQFTQQKRFMVQNTIAFSRHYRSTFEPEHTSGYTSNRSARSFGCLHKIAREQKSSRLSLCGMLFLAFGLSLHVFLTGASFLACFWLELTCVRCNGLEKHMYNLYEQEKTYHTTLMILVLVDSFSFLFKHWLNLSKNQYN